MLKRGIFTADTLLNVLLSCIFFVPGMLHAWFIVLRHPQELLHTNSIAQVDGPSPALLEAGLHTPGAGSSSDKQMSADDNEDNDYEEDGEDGGARRPLLRQPSSIPRMLTPESTLRLPSGGGRGSGRSLRVQAGRCMGC